MVVIEGGMEEEDRERRTLESYQQEYRRRTPSSTSRTVQSC